MCEFISFKIEQTDEGLQIRLANTLNSHADIPSNGCEAEWTKDDRGESLTVRIPDDWSEGKREALRQFVLKSHPTWKGFVKWAFGQFTEFGYLDLHGTPITSLPEGLTVGGYLDLHGTPITSLPEGLTVGGSLDLHGTPITSLPEGLTVGGSLDLRGTHITSLPEGLTVGGTIYKNF